MEYPICDTIPTSALFFPKFNGIFPSFSTSYQVSKTIILSSCLPNRLTTTKRLSVESQKLGNVMSRKV